MLRREGGGENGERSFVKPGRRIPVAARFVRGSFLVLMSILLSSTLVGASGILVGAPFDCGSAPYLLGLASAKVFERFFVKPKLFRFFRAFAVCGFPGVSHGSSLVCLVQVRKLSALGGSDLAWASR